MCDRTPGASIGAGEGARPCGERIIPATGRGHPGPSPLPHLRPNRRLHSEGPARHPRGLSRGEAPVLGRIPGGLQWSERAQLQLLLPLKFGRKQDSQGPPGSLVMPLPCNATAWWTDRLPGHRPAAHLQSGRGSQGPLQGKGKPAAWPFPAGLTARTPWHSRGRSHRAQRLLPGPGGCPHRWRRRPAALCSRRPALSRPCRVCEGQSRSGGLLAQMRPASCLKLQLAPPSRRDLSPPPLPAETLTHSSLP